MALNLGEKEQSRRNNERQHDGEDNLLHPDTPSLSAEPPPQAWREGIILDQLEQHTARRLWMHKYIFVAPGSPFDLVFHQMCSAGFDPLDGSRQIGHAYRNMMQAFAALLDKLRDHRIARGGFKQLEPRPAGWKHHNFDFLVLHDDSRAGINTKRIAVERQRGVNRANSNSDMVDFGGHGFV